MAIRIITTVVLALGLAGCAALTPRGEQVPLLTGNLGCYAGGEGGPTALLVAEPKYGTSFSGQPVMWPAGYTARRVGTEVIVLDAQGIVKATTGRTYHISQAFAPMLPPYSNETYTGPQGAFPAAAHCGYHWDFIDCTANPTDTWCQPRELPSYIPTEHPSGWQPE